MPHMVLWFCLSSSSVTMWSRLIFLCIFVKCLRLIGAICTMSRYDDGFSNWVKCSNATVSEAMAKGGSLVAAITIIHSRIINVQENAFFKYAKSLQTLHIQNCETRELHMNAFAGLTLLKKLSLPNNNITVVRANWFDSLPALEQLDLSFNMIDKIDPWVFARLTNLRRLNLDDNLITCLEPKDMIPMRSLAKFRIIENPLSLLCRGKMTLWFNDKGINYSNGLRRDSESWLDRVLWLCAEEDYGHTRTEKGMRECVLLNLFNQLRLALKTTNSYQISSQQCGVERRIFTTCVANNGQKSGSITNGEAISNMLLALRGAQQKLQIS